ncbi:MAG: FAD-dependent oxidoreductase [Pseudomonadales bacterium]
MSKATIKRRKLVQAGLGLAAGSGLSAKLAAHESAKQETRFDASYDVVVVGSGSGLCGALKAATAGLKVLVLEKDQGIGGTTLVSGGVLWVPNNRVQKAAGLEDNEKDARTYLQKLSLGQASDELIDAFVEQGPDMLEFVEANTQIEWRVSQMLGDAADYHPDWPGSRMKGRSIEPVRDGVGMSGGILISSLASACREAGVTFMTKAPAKQLIAKDSEQGVEVLGVLAETEQGSMRIQARRGVLMASGGFERNPEMMKHFLRGPVSYSWGAEGNVGDGIKMGMALGADLRNMNECWHQVAYTAEGEAVGHVRGAISLFGQIERRNASGITVNRYGERFANECAAYDVSWRSFHTWENWGGTGMRNMPAYAIFDQKARENETIGGATKDQPLPDWVTVADTLEELAAKLNIDEKGLDTTVQRFNKYAKKGQDPDFHRGENTYDRGGDHPVSVALAPLDKGPFYGAEVSPATLGTCGGLRVNAKAEVIDVFDRPIRGLYASGNTSGVGSPGALYGGGGGTLGPAFTFAYIAGKELVSREI